MDGDARPPVPPRPEPEQETLADQLMRRPWRFEFAQAVRLLERLAPERAPVGGDGSPNDEAVRFAAHLTLAFPASELQDVEVPEQPGSPLKLLVNFMGLAGPLGAMPTHYTELLADPTRRRQTGPLREFFDLFNHRLVSLFYRAWEKYRFPVAYERRQSARQPTERGVDVFSDSLFCLIGMGTQGLRHRLRVEDDILLYYAGLLSKRPRAAVALEGMLQDYFGVPVQVDQFSGQWFLMNEDVLTRLGTPGQNAQLGVSAVLWERVWDPQARFRIKLGPLTWAEFQEFLPDREAHRHLVELTRFFVGEEFTFEVQPILRADEVPPCVLGSARATRLGWAMWMRTEPFERDADQALFAVRVARAAP